MKDGAPFFFLPYIRSFILAFKRVREAFSGLVHKLDLLRSIQRIYDYALYVFISWEERRSLGEAKAHYNLPTLAPACLSDRI